MTSKQISDQIFSFKLVILISSVIFLVLLPVAYFTGDVKDYFIGYSPILFLTFLTSVAWFYYTRKLKKVLNLEAVQEVLDD